MLEDFTNQLMTFNPYWIAGALLFGFLASRIFKRGFAIFAPLGYLLFVFPTIKLDEYLRVSTIGTQYLQVAREWSMTPFDASSLAVSLGFVLVTGVFWGLSQ
jgi:hypothetical protein